MGQDLILNGLVVKGVQNFRHLGALINSENVISNEKNQRFLQVTYDFIVYDKYLGLKPRVKQLKLRYTK